MGKTNRKKFQDLLDEVSNNTQQSTPNRDFQDSFTTDENTFQEEQEDNSVFDDTEDESLTTKNWVPSMNWEPKSHFQIGEDLVWEAGQKIRPVHGQVPRQGTPDLEETCLFVPAVKGGVSQSSLPCQTVGTGVGQNKKNAADWISNNYLNVDGSFHRIKLYASILESYDIPWTVSKYKLKIRKSGEVYYKITAIIEFGVLHFGDDPLWEVRHHLEQTTDSMAKESYYSQAEYSYERDGVYYFPIGSNKGHVAACGVFNNSGLMNHSTSDDVLEAEHLQVLKQGSRR